jgi:hypothetical protein
MDKRWIIEQDTQVIETWRYAVEAETLEEAIEKTMNMDPHEIARYPNDECSYDDSHEADYAEWTKLAPVLKFDGPCEDSHETSDDSDDINCEDDEDYEY